jgi:NTE family protein
MRITPVKGGASVVDFCPIMSPRLITVLGAVLTFCAALPAHPQAQGAVRPRPVVAVVLSGGGALGFAHVGVLKVIEEIGIPVDIVVGTSMGAIVGGLYAAGYSPSDMERLSRGLDWQSAFDDALADSPYSFREREVSRRYPFSLDLNASGFWADRGVFGAQSITTLLELMTVNVSRIDDFDRLPRRFRAVAADITTGEQVVLGRGSLADSMRASATIPLLFKPFMLDGRALVDGGIVNRLPTDIAREMGADIIIAVEVGESPSRTAADLRTMVDMVGQLSRVLIEQNAVPRRALADVVIAPDLTGFLRTDFHRATGIIRRGEEQARAARTALEGIAARIAASRPLEPRAGQEGSYLASSTPPVARTLQVQGASPDNEQYIRRVFTPLLDAPLDPRRMQAAMNDAYQSGRFEEVRVGVAPNDAGDALIVSTVAVAPARAAALLGLSYQGDLSETLSNTLVISPAIMVRDLSGKGSQLIVDAHIVDTLGGGIEYFQPLGGGLFVDASAGYLFDRQTFLQDDTALVGRVDRNPTAGAWTGFVLGQTGEVKAGLAWSSHHFLDPSHPVAVDSTASLARFRVAMDTRPARVFPMRGFSFNLGYDRALTALGGSSSFRKLSLDADVRIPLFSGLVAGLSFSGGTDFTASSASANALDPVDEFSLRTDSQFRGFQAWDVVGSHKLAAGLDLQYRLPGLYRLLGTDFYILGNVSAGNCWADLPQVTGLLPLRYGASLGLGARIQRNFQVATRVCYVDTGRLQLSVDVGSIAIDEATGALR